VAGWQSRITPSKFSEMGGIMCLRWSCNMMPHDAQLNFASDKAAKHINCNDKELRQQGVS
jgi:hypothetical protein